MKRGLVGRRSTQPWVCLLGRSCTEALGERRGEGGRPAPITLLRACLLASTVTAAGEDLVWAARLQIRGMEAAMQPPWDTGREIFSLKLPGSVAAPLAPLPLRDGACCPCLGSREGWEQSSAGSPRVMLLSCCRCHPYHCCEASGTDLEEMQTFDSQHCISKLAKYFGLVSVSCAAGAPLGREEVFPFQGGFQVCMVEAGEAVTRMLTPVLLLVSLGDKVR